MRVIEIFAASVLALQVLHLLGCAPTPARASFLLSKPTLLARSKPSTTTAASVDSGDQADPQASVGVGSGQLAEDGEQLSSQQRQTSTQAAKSKSEDDNNSEYNNNNLLPAADAHDKRLFVMELLRMLHEKYGKKQIVNIVRGDEADEASNKDREDRHQPPQSNRRIMSQLLEAISADGDIRRLTDWLQNSFNLASMGELTTQFVVSKLGSVNCAALFPPDGQESLVPRFLLFNEHFADVPYELSLAPTSNECLAQGRFDPLRKTVVLVHGYLTGYTLVDGMTNIKNRLLDLNKVANERAMAAFVEAARSNGSYVLTGDLETKLRRQKYNVIIVDWFSGANPVPRANYIQAAANARAVGEHIAEFLINLVTQCRTSSASVQIIAHSLGCHVAGFTGKAMGAAGHTLGKITHLDPIGLCFGRLFSATRFRLSPNDAIDTQAVHVSLNLFDNPLDGARSNFLVNGGRDQAGCQGTSELKNSTTSSVSLLFDPNAKFSPCSHLRALSLFEDDHSSAPQQCQIVGYRCATYGRFLAGKCGKCDSMNNQCRLMSFAPLMQQYARINLMQPNRHVQWDTTQAPQAAPNYVTSGGYVRERAKDYYRYSSNNSTDTTGSSNRLLALVRNHSNGSIAWVIDDDELNVRIGNVIAKLKPKLVTTPSDASGSASGEEDTSGASYATASAGSNNLAVSTASDKHSPEEPARPKKNPRYVLAANELASRRSDRRLIGGDHRDLLAQTLDKIRADTRNVLTGGWTSMLNVEPKYKVSSLLNFASPPMSLLAGLVAVPRPSIELDHIQVPLPNGLPGGHPAGSASEAAAFLSSQTGAALEQQPDLTPAPIGSQPLPAGSSIGPLYFVGTSAMSPYCVNYYQFRMLIAESRIRKHLQSGSAHSKAAPSRMAHISSHKTPAAAATQHQNALKGPESGNDESSQQADQQQQQKPPRQAVINRDMLHLTIKLSDSNGHFFKGFTLNEDTRTLPRAPASELMGTRGPTSSETMVELTLLLNTTSSEPVRVSETIISYYFHEIVLADTIEVNYMSNISPDVRARYSSVLCPVAINDQHQLVRYIECNKIGAR